MSFCCPPRRRPGVLPRTQQSPEPHSVSSEYRYSVGEAPLGAVWLSSDWVTSRDEGKGEKSRSRGTRFGGTAISENLDFRKPARFEAKPGSIRAGLRALTESDAKRQLAGVGCRQDSTQAGKASEAIVQNGGDGRGRTLGRWAGGTPAHVVSWTWEIGTRAGTGVGEVCRVPPDFLAREFLLRGS